MDLFLSIYMSDDLRELKRFCVADVISLIITMPFGLYLEFDFHFKHK